MMQYKETINNMGNKYNNFSLDSKYYEQLEIIKNTINIYFKNEYNERKCYCKDNINFDIKILKFRLIFTDLEIELDLRQLNNKNIERKCSQLQKEKCKDIIIKSQKSIETKKSNIKIPQNLLDILRRNHELEHGKRKYHTSTKNNQELDKNLALLPQGLETKSTNSYNQLLFNILEKVKLLTVNNNYDSKLVQQEIENN